MQGAFSAAVAALGSCSLAMPRCNICMQLLLPCCVAALPAPVPELLLLLKIECKLYCFWVQATGAQRPLGLGPARVGAPSAGAWERTHAGG